MALPQRPDATRQTDEVQQFDAMREFLDGWAEETGLPDPEEVEAMRHRYFNQ